MIPYKCPVCGKACRKFPSSKDATCGSRACRMEQRVRHRRPRVGTCSRCRKVGKLQRLGAHKGKPPICRTCFDLEKRTGACKNCGKVRRLQSHGVCSTCYTKLELNSRKVVCSRCGVLKTHMARGFCINCYRSMQSSKHYWQNPEKSRMVMNTYRRRSIDRNRDRFNEHNRAYLKIYRKVTPEQIERVKVGTSFVTSGGLDAAELKRGARCIANFNPDDDRKVVIFKMGGKDGYRIQIVDFVAGKEKFLMIRSDRALRRYLEKNGFRLGCR